MQYRKKLVFSMVSSICKFGITYILPNNSWIFRCSRSVKLVVYAVHALSMQLHAVVAIRCLGSWAIIHGARWCVGVVLLSVSGCAPSPPPPRGAGKTGRLSGDGPCATTHSLLRLPAKHRPARCYSQVTRKLLASFKFIESSTQVYRTTFSRLSKGIPYIIRVICI